MVQGMHIPADDTLPLEVREFADIVAYQEVVDGWIEPVDINPLGITLFVNEEGLVRRMPFNARATFLWWYFVPDARNHAMLVGDAVMVGQPDRDGDTTDVPREVVELLTAKSGYRLRVEVPRRGISAMDRAGLVMPLANGDPDLYEGTARYEDYFTALVWAMVIDERLEMKEVHVAITPEPPRSIT